MSDRRLAVVSSRVERFASGDASRARRQNKATRRARTARQARNGPATEGRRPPSAFSSSSLLFRPGALARLGGGGGEGCEPGLQERRPRLGEARGAKAVRALLEIVPAGVVPLAGKAVLVAQQRRRVGIVLGPPLDRAQGPGHRLLGLVAPLADRGGVLLEPGAVGSPQAAGARLAVGRLEDAGGDLGGDEDRAVDHVEREGAGRHVDVVPVEAVGAPFAGRLDRLLADDVDDAALRRVGDAFAGQAQLVDLKRLAGAGELKQPLPAVQHQRRSVDRGGVGSGDGLRPGRLGRFRSLPRLLRLGRDGRPSGRRSRRCARQSELRADGSDGENEAADNEGKAPIHRASLGSGTGKERLYSIRVLLHRA